MARRRDRQPNQRKAYSEHHQRVEAYTQEVNRLFDEMVSQAVHLVGIFEGMEDTPALERALQGLKKTFAERMLANISLGMMNEWSAASRVQDELLRRVLGERFPEKYTLNRPQALEAFLKRKTAGLSLSQRIWKLAGQAEEELTTAIAVGLSDGLSAHELSREVRKYLQDPDKLFRRVRDDEGDLKLSKPAKAYRPGQGVYRSSHKNALRLTRTEINMAYRRGEQSRWQDMDFVVGYEVKRSGTGYPCPVCEALAGRYPKDFVWSTWHPHCRCYAIPILKTEDELFEDSDKPSINEVKEPHEGFQRWVKEQEGRIKLYAQRGTLPLFLKENKQALRLLKGEKWSGKDKSILDGFFSSEQEYNSYGKEWIKAYFSKDTGGYNVYHIKHQFSNQGGGGRAEKIVGKLLADRGKKVEFLPEGVIDGDKSADLLFDNNTWDVKNVNSDNQRTIRKAYIDATKKAEAVIFYDESKQRTDTITSAVLREIGNISKSNGKIIRAYIIDDKGILHEIKKG